MRPAARPTAHRLTRAGAALLVAAGTALVAAAPVAAEPPVDLPGPVTDLAGVLTPAQEQQVDDALADLAAGTPYQLFVVYVDTFDGLGNADWAATTAEESGLGRDDILLAVAVEARRYQVSVQDDIALSDAALTRVEQDDIEPALRDDDWAGAAVAAASGYEREANPPVGAGAVVLRVLLGLAAVGLLVAGVRWWLLRRRAAARAAQELAELDDRSAQALVAADEAVTTGTQDLGFAEAQLGPEVVGPYAAALAEARTLLADAFRSRRLLDDDEPEPDAQRRTLALAVLDTCARVDALLVAQREAVDALRDLHARAPEDLAAARDEAAALTSRAQAAGSTWQDVAPRYAPSATADVPGAVADATALAAGAAADAEAGLAVLGSDRAAAVVRVRTAREALTRATAVLDSLDQRATDLATAPEAIAAALAEVDADLADAARLGGDDPAVQQAARAARSAAERGRSPEATQDPLAVLAALRQQDVALDAVLDPLREAEAALRHAVERLPQVQAVVRSRLAATRATIDRDRWSVGAGARARLTEAERLSVQGDLAARTDPVAALRVLRAAADLAEQAERAARGDVDAARMRLTGGGGGGGLTFSSGGWSSSWGSSSRRSSGSSGSSRSSSRRSSSSGRSRSSGSSGRSGGGRRGGGGRF